MMGNFTNDFILVQCLPRLLEPKLGYGQFVVLTSLCSLVMLWPLGCLPMTGFEEWTCRGVPWLLFTTSDSAQVGGGNTVGLSPSPTRWSRLGRPSENHNYIAHRTIVFPLSFLTPMTPGFSQYAHGGCGLNLIVPGIVLHYSKDINHANGEWSSYLMAFWDSYYVSVKLHLNSII